MRDLSIAATLDEMGQSWCRIFHLAFRVMSVEVVELHLAAPIDRRGPLLFPYGKAPWSGQRKNVIFPWVFHWFLIIERPEGKS